MKQELNGQLNLNFNSWHLNISKIIFVKLHGDRHVFVSGSLI